MVVCVTYCMAGDDDGAGVVTIESARMLTMKFKIMVCVTYCMAGLALLAMCMSLIQEGLMIKVLFLDSIFIGPKSDHWQPLSRTCHHYQTKGGTDEEQNVWREENGHHRHDQHQVDILG